MNIAFKHALLVMLFLLVIPMVCADPVVLPIINQDEFQACVLGWCQTVAPPFLFTDINLTFANYSYISVYSNETNYSLEANHSLYCDDSINSNYSSYANESEYLNGLPSSTFYNSSNPSGFISGFTETDPLWSGNYSLVAFTNQQSQWNVNSSNYSNYSGASNTSNYLHSYSISGCNGTQVYPVSTNYEHVEEVYINGTTFHPNDLISVTCQFREINRTGVGSYPSSEYLWYYNRTNWTTIYSNYSYFDEAGTNLNGKSTNRSFVFTVNATEGTHVVRCNINYRYNASDFCNNKSSSYYDTDDVNFTVTSGATNDTPLTCSNIFGNCNSTTIDDCFKNIVDDYKEASYFYPYSNPYNFLNSSYNSTYNTWAYNQTTPAISYFNSNPFNWINTSFNSTYDALISYNTSFNETRTNSLYAPINEPLWSANYTAFNTSWSSTYNSSYLTAETDWNNNYSNVAFKNAVNTFTSNQNFSNINFSFYLASESIPTCSKYYNSTGVLKWCDCFNATHKWMANTC